MISWVVATRDGSHQGLRTQCGAGATISRHDGSTKAFPLRGLSRRPPIPLVLSFALGQAVCQRRKEVGLGERPMFPPGAYKHFVALFFTNCVNDCGSRDDCTPGKFYPARSEPRSASAVAHQGRQRFEASALVRRVPIPLTMGLGRCAPKFHLFWFVGPCGLDLQAQGVGGFWPIAGGLSCEGVRQSARHWIITRSLWFLGAEHRKLFFPCVAACALHGKQRAPRCNQSSGTRQNSWWWLEGHGFRVRRATSGWVPRQSIFARNSG